MIAEAIIMSFIPCLSVSLIDDPGIVADWGIGGCSNIGMLLTISGSKGVFGSLTFGGYDSSRFVPSNLSFSLAPDITRDLVVGLQSITSTMTNHSTTGLLPSPILTFIDSTQPYIYLPIESCQAFEAAFGLVYNETAKVYWLDDAQHQALLAMNPNITFTIGNSLTGGTTVDIVFPYASFDLLATSPAAETPTRFFPLRRAANDTQYTLGRTFLQEAYVTILTQIFNHHNADHL